mmetsp:Transcript_7586/g.13317  ORF Transcript_7586/g.13317 Transcript_7586/m.13317 type:complete len:82 (+) Transcript_7586:225-470(+)
MHAIDPFLIGGRCESLSVGTSLDMGIDTDCLEATRVVSLLRVNVNCKRNSRRFPGFPMDRRCWCGSSGRRSIDYLQSAMVE